MKTKFLKAKHHRIHLSFFNVIDCFVFYSGCSVFLSEESFEKTPYCPLPSQQCK